MIQNLRKENRALLQDIDGTLHRSLDTTQNSEKKQSTGKQPTNSAVARLGASDLQCRAAQAAHWSPCAMN